MGFHVPSQTFPAELETGIRLRQSKVDWACFQIMCAKFAFDKLFQVTFLKGVFFGFSIKNTSLKFLQKTLLSYHVQHYILP